MTARQKAAQIRNRYKTDALNLSQIGTILGFDRKTAEKLIAHLPCYVHESGRRWDVDDIADYLISVRSE